ncbi:uncharacterized protein CXQ87_000412 [Candidozyma duobushaemuli]|uniref:Vacuolar protein sorting-associated protein 29 n=2 Tax=Candidozyma TaxID=3303203 RepID=A0ABX8I4R6_9ASCO|nr:uncharacterized protein CXQ87_000412 [[Candida] duobushaemulonis]PVH17523.1 hypothetical protein CXQ87_000412 [[Candida] duobushaemulonis]QWU86158.1 hypothetical protein CA3LBN_000376 [[Candida] haemuloni]
MFTLAIGDIFVPDRSPGIPQKFLKLLAPNAGKYPSNPRISQVVCLGNITQSKETLEFLYNISPSLHIVQGEYDDASIVSQQLEHISGSYASLPQYKVVTLDNFRIGFTNGHQIMPRNDPLSLLAFAREINVDILIWGGTHRVEAYTLDGKYFINPGSASGAFHFGWPEIDEEEEEQKDESKQEDNSEDTKESEEDKHDKDDLKEGEPEEKKDDEKSDTNEEDGQVENLNEPIPSFCLLETQGPKCTLYIYTYINDEVKVDKVIYQKE